MLGWHLLISRLFISFHFIFSSAAKISYFLINFFHWDLLRESRRMGGRAEAEGTNPWNRLCEQHPNIMSKGEDEAEFLRLLLVKHEEKLLLLGEEKKPIKTERMSLKICRRAKEKRKIYAFFTWIHWYDAKSVSPRLVEEEGKKENAKSDDERSEKRKTFNVKKIEMKFRRVTKLCRFTPAKDGMNISFSEPIRRLPPIYDIIDLD